MISMLRILFGIGLLLFQIQSLKAMEEEAIFSVESNSIGVYQGFEEETYEMLRFASTCIDGQEKGTKTPNSLVVLATIAAGKQYGANLWKNRDKKYNYSEIIKSNCMLSFLSDLSLPFYFCNGNANALYLLQSVVYGVGNVSPLVKVDNRHKEWIEKFADIIASDVELPIYMYELYKPDRLRILFDSGLFLPKDVKRYLDGIRCDDIERKDIDACIQFFNEYKSTDIPNIVRRTKLLKKAVKDDDIDCIQKLIFSGIAKKDLVSLIFKGKTKFLSFLFSLSKECMLSALKAPITRIGKIEIKKNGKVKKRPITVANLVSLVINKENLTCNDAAMKILVILMQEYFNDDNLERVVDERLLIYDHIKSFIELVKEIGVLNKPVVPFFNKELSYYEKKTPLCYAINTYRYSTFGSNVVHFLIENGATECAWKDKEDRTHHGKTEDSMMVYTLMQAGIFLPNFINFLKEDLYYDGNIRCPRFDTANMNRVRMLLKLFAKKNIPVKLPISTWINFSCLLANYRIKFDFLRLRNGYEVSSDDDVKNTCKYFIEMGLYKAALHCIESSDLNNLAILQDIQQMNCVEIDADVPNDGNKNKFKEFLTKRINEIKESPNGIEELEELLEEQEPIYYYIFRKPTRLITKSLVSISLFCAHTFNSCVSWCKSWFI